MSYSYPASFWMAEPGRTTIRTHTHTHTHTLLSSIDHTDTAKLLELEKLVYLPEGAVCVRLIVGHPGLVFTF